MRTNLSEQSLGCIRLCYLQRISKKKKTQRQSHKFSFILLNRNHQQQRWDRSRPNKHTRRLHLPVNARFHMTSNVCVSEFSQKYAPNLRKSLYWHIENRKSIEDFLREVDEDSVSINNGEFQSNGVVGTFGKAVKVSGAFTGRCSRRYLANSRKNNFQIEKEHFVDKLKHTNP